MLDWDDSGTARSPRIRAAWRRRLRLVCRTAVLAAVLPVGTAWACAAEQSPCEKPLRLGPLRSLTVQQAPARNAASSDQATPCSGFSLNARQVRRYLRQAGEIGERAYLHEVDASPCVARGTLATGEGRAAWQIGQGREGRLLWADGHVTYLHCRRCSSAVFAD